MRSVAKINLAHGIRRPAVARLAAKLQAQHPDWTEQRCIIQAKLIVTESRNTTGATA